VASAVQKGKQKGRCLSNNNTHGKNCENESGKKSARPWPRECVAAIRGTKSSFHAGPDRLWRSTTRLDGARLNSGGFCIIGVKRSIVRAAFTASPYGSRDDCSISQPRDSPLPTSASIEFYSLAPQPWPNVNSSAGFYAGPRHGWLEPSYAFLFLEMGMWRLPELQAEACRHTLSSDRGKWLVDTFFRQ
jgi:hypothetical protein